MENEKTISARNLIIAIRDDPYISGDAFARVNQYIDDAPDAVKYGRWINPYMNRYGHPCHCCSICGFKASYQDKNYCPNCGAKMDGERK